jgi:hypothetical protein
LSGGQIIFVAYYTSLIHRDDLVTELGVHFEKFETRAYYGWDITEIIIIEWRLCLYAAGKPDVNIVWEWLFTANGVIRPRPRKRKQPEPYAESLEIRYISGTVQ